MRTITVTYSNNDTITTSMAAHLTDADIRKYFAIGRTFNIGNGGNDLLAQVVRVDIIA